MHSIVNSEYVHLFGEILQYENYYTIIIIIPSTKCHKHAHTYTCACTITTTATTTTNNNNNNNSHPPPPTSPSSLSFFFTEPFKRCTTTKMPAQCNRTEILLLIIMYIYHVLINAQSAHMIHINLNIIFYTHAGCHSCSRA